MYSRALHTTSAPAAVGPYSQAIAVSDVRQMVFCSGQIPLGPDGALIQDVAQATRACMKQLNAVLGASGLSLRHVVRCTIYLVDMKDFAKVNEAYAEFFEGTPPARACVEVRALPKGAAVEIDAIAAA
ncbi:MAG: Rid family detoxifying hydrolase [Myxococcota bacterium]